ncbi:MAG: hypothetical protein LBT42_01720 [Tannerella sp.]|jgi:glycosyltransferase involved in cell wall biosynthesis|nr:hypothetical protein [Tannerella sp.]
MLSRPPLKSVLILCDIFPPAFGPRMGYLCKYLKINGWRPVVLTEKIDDDTFSFLNGFADATYVNFYTKRGLAGKIEWGWTFLRNILFDYKDKRMYREALKLVDNECFELVVCSTYRTFPLKAASWLAKTTKLPLVVDLRDIIEQYTGNEFITHRIPKFFGLERVIASSFRRKSLRVRNEVLRMSSCVTTVSPWHVSVLKAYNANTHLIYNGFDPEIFYPASIASEKFYITYTGRLLSTAMRNPDLLFQAVSRLAKENAISSETFQIRWFVDDKSREIIKSASAEYPEILDYMGFFGYVSADRIPAVLNESAILLILTNKSSADGPKGVMTTKFFESLAVGKPLLCVRGDEGSLEAVINKTRSGLSAHNADEVYAFLKEYYFRWKKSELYTDNADKDEIMKFSREVQTKQFIQLFETLIS